MRINEVLTESEQLDELDIGPLARGVGGFARGMAQGAGGALGGVVGAAQAAKQGYTSARDFVSGKSSPSSSPSSRSGGTSASRSGAAGASSSGTTAAGAAGNAPEASDQQAKVGVGQINKIIPTLRLRDLQSVKKTLDAAIAAKARPAAGGASAPASPGAPAGSTPPAGGAARPRGQEVDLGGKKYRWAGAQWVDVATGRVADRATAAQLNNTPTT